MVVLERDRHEQLIAELRAAGARVKLIRDGDVAPAIAVGAARHRRRHPLRHRRHAGGHHLRRGVEVRRRRHPGHGSGRATTTSASSSSPRGSTRSACCYTNDLVRGEDVFVAATGVTNGPLLSGVQYTPGGAVTDSIVMRSRSGTVRRISAQQSLEKLSALTGFEYR